MLIQADLLLPQPLPSPSKQSKRLRRRVQAEKKRFGFSLARGREKDLEGADERAKPDELISDYVPPPRSPSPPRPGIRVSSLGEGPSFRAGSASLQRSLSSPASLRSRSFSFRSEQVEWLDSGASPDCQVGPSRALYTFTPSATTNAFPGLSDYFAYPPHKTAYNSSDETSPMRHHDSDSSSVVDFVSCIDPDEVLIFEEGEALPLVGVGLDDLPFMPGALPATPAAEVQLNPDELLCESFDNFIRADAVLGAAIEALADRQQIVEERAVRNIARRSSSLPLLPRVDLLTRPGMVVRSRWQAISALVRPQPDLPLHDGQDTQSSDESEEDEPDPRVLIRLAVEDVRQAQAGLLASLSELVIVLGMPPHGPYEQNVLVSAQNLLADATFDIESNEIQTLRAFAMRTCETLERVREIGVTLVPPLSRQSKVRVSAIAGGRPLAPQRESSLTHAARRFDNRGTLLTTLQAWDIAYRDFAGAWRRHKDSARTARRQARQNLRSSQIRSVATAHGLDQKIMTVEGIGVVTATVQLVSSTLTKAIDEGLLTKDEAIHLEPRVFFALPRLSILFGARDALLPSSWEVPTPTMTVASNSKPERPLSLFLPRVCGSLPNETIRDIRTLSQRQFSQLCKLLAGLSASTSTSPRMSGTTEADKRVWALYREVAALADRESLSAKKWSKVLSKCLKAWAIEHMPAEGHL